MLRSCALVLSLLLLAIPARVDAQVFERFEIDPTRSFLQFDSGEVSGQLGESTFAFAALTAQPGTGPVPLSGDMILRFDPDLTTPNSVSAVAGTTDIRPANDYTVSPGPGAIPGAGPAAFGLEFDDPAVGVGGQVALRDLIFIFNAGLQVFPNSLGPWGLRGSVSLTQIRGTYDTDFGGETFVSLPVGKLTPLFGGGVFSGDSQLEEVSPGVYEITLPFQTDVGSFGLPGPVTGATLFTNFSGVIVGTTQVPEPSIGMGMVAGVSVLIGLARRRARR